MTDDEIERLRQLRGEELVTEVMFRKWYVQLNDLIGGWCIMPIDQPPSSGCFEIADFLSRSHAQHIAELHNAWLDGRHPAG